MDDDILVYGTAYTPFYHDPTSDKNRRPDTTYYTFEEMTQEFAKSLIGLPVLIEHTVEETAGYILHAYVTDTYQIKTILRITDPWWKTILSNRLLRDPSINDGMVFNELSLGNVVLRYVDEDNKEVMYPTEAREVSIVQYGDRPFTTIDFYTFIPDHVTDPLKFSLQYLENFDKQPY